MKAKEIAIYSLLFSISLFIGRLWFSPLGMTPFDKIILFDVRMPRIVLVSLAGAALGLSGLSFQNIFRNYLAGPGILGVTSGSAFGAAIAILLLPFPYSPIIQASAFFFGIIAVLLAYKISRMMGESILSLILAGLIVSAFFSAMVGLIKFTADPYNKLPTIVFWLLGSFAGIRWFDVETSFAPLIVGIFGILYMRWIFNVLSLGDEEARALGLDVKKWRSLGIFFATLGTASATSVAGMIAWIGVVSPHIARLLVGFDNRKLVPATAFIGAALLLICDDLARSLTPMELPLSVMTNIIGAPILFAILAKRRKMYGIKGNRRGVFCGGQEDPKRSVNRGQKRNNSNSRT